MRTDTLTSGVLWPIPQMSTSVPSVENVTDVTSLQCSGQHASNALLAGQRNELPGKAGIPILEISVRSTAILVRTQRRYITPRSVSPDVAEVTNFAP